MPFASVSVSDPSLSLGQRGRQRGEGGTAGASRLLLGDLNADMSEDGKCVTGSFPVTWILRA